MRHDDGRDWVWGTLGVLLIVSSLPLGSMARDQDEADMRRRGRVILDKIASIREKRSQQEDLLDQLERHGRLLAQGIDPDQIDTYFKETKNRMGRDVVVQTRLTMKDGSTRVVKGDVLG